MIENSKNGAEMDARRRTASHFIFLCEKFLAPAYLLEETKNRRTALKMLSAGLKISKTAPCYGRHSGAGNHSAKLAFLKAKEASAYLNSYDTASRMCFLRRQIRLGASTSCASICEKPGKFRPPRGVYAVVTGLIEDMARRMASSRGCT